jgi:serine/threonine-protein kinase ATR
LKLIVPLQKSLTIVLPKSHENKDKHNPFPNTYITISGFHQNILVYKSKAKPKRVGIIGSDGIVYHFLGLLFLTKAKPSDDLRKDNRLMEFNTMINRLLKKDSESRKRNLCKIIL